MTGYHAAFVVLWRAFLSQFLASESVNSDVQLRRTIIWVLAFLVTPCLYLTAIVLPTFEIVRLVAAARHAPEMIERMLAQLAVIYVSYSIVTTGLITVFVWDALSFDRRDAMVIGPLPLTGPTIIAAKLAALVTFLLGTSLAVNLSAGVPYALITGSNDGVAKIIWHLTGYLAGTLGGAVFIFSTIVAARGLMILIGGARMASSVGSLLQFLFVSAVLCFVLVPVAMGKTQPIFLAATAAGWMPTNWYFGLFEWLRGSAQPEVRVLADRALIALAVAVGAAVAVTFLGFWRQMQSALAPQQPSGFHPLFQVRRAIGGFIVRRDGVARGILDFILMTLGRNSEQRAYMGIGAAIAVGVISVALSRKFGGLEALMRPRTIVLWMPLVFGYWIAIGLRASFFVPSDLRASWSFYANATAMRSSYWSAVRASMIAVVLLPAITVNAILVAPLLGLSIAARHTLVIAAVLILTVELLSLTVKFIPYTRVYEPGHAKLKTRWPLYLIGMFLVAYVPVRFELALLANGSSLLWAAAAVAVGIVAAEIIGHRTALTWSIEPVELEDSEAATVLNIGNVSRTARL
jgi:hypothetical protein